MKKNFTKILVITLLLSLVTVHVQALPLQVRLENIVIEWLKTLINHSPIKEMFKNSQVPLTTPEPTVSSVPPSEPTASPVPTPEPTPTAHPDLVARSLPIDRSPGKPPLRENFAKGESTWHYEDDSIIVDIERTKYLESTCFVATVQIADASQLRTETGAQEWNHNRTVDGVIIAQRSNAVVAINGDYPNYQPTGYLIRNGQVYRQKADPNRDILIIDEFGDFHILPYATNKMIEAWDGPEIIHAFNFGPGLIIDRTLGKNLRVYFNGADLLRQRVAIGQSGHLSYYLFVTEGRSDGSRGLTLKEFQDFVSQYPVLNCYNLDGGNSAYLIINNKRINAVDFKDVRNINDIVYFATTQETESTK